jgi:hypothetical protein
MKRVLSFACLFLVAVMLATAQITAPAEPTQTPIVTTTPAPSAEVDPTEKYFVMLGGGWGPATGGRGEGSIGVRFTQNVYAVLDMNLAGGVGAIVGDVLYRAASTRGVTLWGRAGAGASTTNTALETKTSPTFGGGLMLTYDLSRVSQKLAGLEGFFTTKVMCVTDTFGGAANVATSTVVKPQYLLGLKFNWAGN